MPRGKPTTGTRKSPTKRSTKGGDVIATAPDTIERPGHMDAPMAAQGKAKCTRCGEYTAVEDLVNGLCPEHQEA